MNGDAVTNPYHLDDVSRAPFAGRTSALARLHQQLADTSGDEAVLYIGRANVGKTALLRHFGDVFEEQFVGVYLPLADTILENESDWLMTLARAATGEIVQRGFTLSRLHDLAPPEADIRAWFAETFLTEIMGVIRPHRHLVYLLDDAEVLLDAVSAKQLPDDTFAYLQGLLKQYPQMDMVLTLDSRRETSLRDLRPLVGLNSVYRLSSITPDETAWLLQEPVAGLYQVTSEAASAVHRATGGAPALLQVFGAALFQRWYASPDHTIITPDDVKTLTPVVYARAESRLKTVWTSLTLNERLVLTAISSLLYADPLRPIETPALETWLVETDYPLDEIAINAALRSLEYHEIITIGAGGVAINAGMMQTWLLDNARLTDPPLQPDDAPLSARTPPRRTLILAVIALVVSLIILTRLSNTPRTSVEPEIAPTVTLSDAE